MGNSATAAGPSATGRAPRGAIAGVGRRSRAGTAGGGAGTCFPTPLLLLPLSP